MDGLAATELLRARDDAPAVIVLTTFDADDHVLRALRAGAGGFLLKDTPPPEILEAIRLVAGGRGDALADGHPAADRRTSPDGGADARRADGRGAARPPHRPRARGRAGRRPRASRTPRSPASSS